MHVASFEFTLSFGWKGLVAGLPPGSVSERQANKDEYLAAGFVLPTDLSYLYAGGGDILSAELPAEIIDDIQHFQSVNPGSGKRYAPVRFEALANS